MSFGPFLVLSVYEGAKLARIAKDQVLKTKI